MCGPGELLRGVCQSWGSGLEAPGGQEAAADGPWPHTGAGAGALRWWWGVPGEVGVPYSTACWKVTDWSLGQVGSS